MHIKSLNLLRVGALIMGWFLVAGVLAGIWGPLIIHYRSQNDYAGLYRDMAARFDIMISLSSLFSGLGNAFFAFLIAAVFRMIEKQAPVGNENAKRLMIVCCLCYIVDALAQCFSFISNLPEAIRLLIDKSPYWPFWFPLSMVTPVLVPILYAASIFVLYTHFTKMVTFESEVA